MQLLSDLHFADEISLLAYPQTEMQARIEELVSNAWTQGKHEETQAHENEPSLRCTNHPAGKCSRRSERVHVPSLQHDRR